MKNIGENFFKQLKTELLTLGVDLNGLAVDHLCYRVQTEEEYFYQKEALTNRGVLLTEAFVNGRPIATFKLFDAFEVDEHKIDLIELPFPKKEVLYETGFEHAEVVIRESFATFQKRYPYLDFVMSGHPNINPELILKTKVGSVKFHYVPLDRVIEIENSNLTDIIFDLDGTIINSIDAIFEINRKVFSKILNRDVSTEEAKDKFHSEFRKLFQAFDVACPKLKNEAMQSWGEVAKEFSYKAFDGIIELLVDLKARGFILHLWTARDEESARKVLSDHKILDIFSSLSFANSENSKPHPKSLKLSLEDKVPNSYIVIGDSPADIIGALNINAIAAGALWDKHACHNSLVKSGAELRFFNVSEFQLWLEKKCS
jgi:HAD superfamily hydrolase (TIGR01549 family)